MATLRHFVGNLISVAYSGLHLCFLKIIYPKNLKFQPIERLSPGVLVDLDRKSMITFGKKVSIHSGSRVTACDGGKLTIGNRTSFNARCIVACRSNIEIGSNVSFGPGVMIYDHDHIMGQTHGVKNTGFNLGSIVIGDNAWIGAGVIILKNIRIGKNCIIAAGSVVFEDIPDNTVLIQKRENTYKRIERNELT